jgi:hypothetical protein
LVGFRCSGDGTSFVEDKDIRLLEVAKAQQAALFSLKYGKPARQNSTGKFIESVGLRI